MCHAAIDPKYLLRESADGFRAATVAVSQPVACPDIPPELMGGLGGIRARMAAAFRRLSFASLAHARIGVICVLFLVGCTGPV